MNFSCDKENNNILPEYPGKIIEMVIDRRIDSISNKNTTSVFITSEYYWSITNAWNIIKNDSLKYENYFIYEGTRSNMLKTDFADIHKEGKNLKIKVFDNISDMEREILVELNGVGLKTEYIKVIQKN